MVNPVIEIDGSFGEGGGQILRYGIALSVLKQKPVTITNIRAKRPNPGLRPQHLTAINCLGALCNADIQGLEIESPTVTFTPKKIQPGTYKFDIGTAGSITLIFQACILGSINTPAPITIRLIGGTDVKWSPSWDYFAQVFLPLLNKIGISTTASLEKRGYYPKGGGEAELTIHPTKQIKPFSVLDQQNFKAIKGLINIANLPDHIATRMKHAVIKTALENNLRTQIQIQQTEALCPGTGLTLWTETKKTILGSTTLGERGISSEKIAERAMTQLLKEITSGATLDTNAIDQILPYLVLSGKPSGCQVRELSNHARTNMWLLQQFCKTNFEMKDQEDVVQLFVK